ncbi:uncharacterized peptidase C1-like protein F26E4.3 [Diadema setosum]|uniref:uncharacterized peptidase C1-like protein F26E4.3 n=1 Tax=Diadema setosum TaxID=31175 RepID=UPI003B3A3B4A
MAATPTTAAAVFFFLVAFTALFVCCSTQTPPAYCAIRGCCPGRDDECHAPFPTSNPTTRCYCDLFCNRSDADCCPDFYGECLGIEPPREIEELRKVELELLCCHDDRDYPVGATLQVNCNTCTCTPVLYEFASFVCEQKDCAIKPLALDQINDGNFGWFAGNQTAFWGTTTEDMMHYRLGTMKPTPAVMSMNELQADMGDLVLPDEFDSRAHWPGLITDVQNQGNCASSWAMSTTATASDRLAIQSNGTLRAAHLSPQHLLSCNVKRQQGCNGGHLDRAWWYMRKRGIVSEQCYPYMSGMSPDLQMKKGTCYIKGRGGPSYCPNPAIRSERYVSTPPYRIKNDERQIQAEIFRNGPVQAVFNVKSDFFMYRGGVYRHIAMKATPTDVKFSTDQSAVQGDGVFEDEEGGWHSVRILGWGVDRSYANRPLKYWLCANSWGKEWGENGLFRVIRGENECGIESLVIGVWAKIDSDMMSPMKSNNVI